MWFRSLAWEALTIWIVSIIIVVIAVVTVRPGLVTSAWTAVIVIIPFIIGTNVGSSGAASAIAIIIAAVVGVVAVALRTHGTDLGAYILVLVFGCSGLME